MRQQAVITTQQIYKLTKAQVLIKKYPSAQDIEQHVADVLNIDGLLQEVKW